MSFKKEELADNYESETQRLLDEMWDRGKLTQEKLDEFKNMDLHKLIKKE